MLTKEEFEKVTKMDVSITLPTMIEYKNYIQRAVLFVTTKQELEDIRDCRTNQGLIDKLVCIANQKWLSSGDTVSLFCAAMAVGTILKEYEWGLQWLIGDGLYNLALQIARPTNKVDLSKCVIEKMIYG